MSAQKKAVPSVVDAHPCPTLIFDGGVPVEPLALVVIERYLIVNLGREFIVYAPSHLAAMARFDRFLVAEKLAWKPGVISIPGRPDQTFRFTAGGTILTEAA